LTKGLRTLNFSENSASAIQISDSTNLLSTLEKLGLQEPQPVIVLVGGASNMTEESLNRLQPVFVRVLAPLAEKLGAYVVDGGTDAGVMRLMGQARAAISAKFSLIGVAPAEKVKHPNLPSSTTARQTLEPNHTHFLLTPGSIWGDESSWLARAATALSGGLPSIAILINGGETALKDLTENLRVGRLVVALAGSGRLADELVEGIQYLEGQLPDSVVKLRQTGLLQTGRIIQFDLFKLGDDIDKTFPELTELLKQHLSPKENKSPPNSVLLRNAWQRQQAYSQNATASQDRFNSLRLWIIGLSVTATILAVIHAELEIHYYRDDFNSSFSQLNEYFKSNPFKGIVKVISEIIRFFLLLVPIVVSVLLAGAVKFDKGTNWLLLRGSSEALKREIYLYRTRTGNYSRNRDAELARRIKIISERLKGSPVHQTCLSPYEEEAFQEKNLKQEALEKEDAFEQVSIDDQNKTKEDDKFSDLTPEKYIDWRLSHQFNRYRDKAKGLDKQLHRFQWGVYLLGGLGTFLVAVQFETWVAATSALTAAFLSFLEVRRIEATLIGFNQAADNLYDTRVWWNSLSDEEKGDARNFRLLVRATEGTLQSENDSWLNDMQDRLSELYGQMDESIESQQRTLSSSKPKSPTKRPAS
jgi:hypothetical protein